MPSRRDSSERRTALFQATPVSVRVGVVAALLLIGLELLAVAAVVYDSDEAPISLMALNVAKATPQAELTPVMNTPAVAEPAPQPVVAEPAPMMQLQPQDPTPVVDESLPANYFGNRPIRHVRTIRMLVTAYSPDERSCGKFADNITASGYSVWTNGMKLVAADTDLLPFGTIVTIPGYNGGRPVPVLDRGGKIKGSRLDVLYPTHEIARGWGAHWLNVDVWEYAD